MTRITIYLLLAASVLVGLGLSASRQEPLRESVATGFRAPAQPPKTSPSTAAAPIRAMPGNYQVLLTRSIFARDGHSSAKAPGPAMNVPTSQGSWVGAPGIETTLAFRGVTLSDGSYSAYIENMTGGGIRRFTRGESIGAGRIVDITLDGLDYQAADKLTRIVLGQNLAGAVIPPPPPPATAPSPGPPPPAEGPGPRGPGRGRPGGPRGMPGPPGPGGPTDGAPAPVAQ